MSSSNSPEVRFAAYRDQVEAIIRDHGWAIQAVFPTEDDSSDTVHFAYTVGLLERGCSCELLIAGLPPQLSHALLNEIAGDIVNSGLSMPPSTWQLEGTFVLRSVFDALGIQDTFALGVANLYYGRPNIPIIQYVWPSKSNAYPWDEGWTYGNVQPVIGRPGPVVERS